MKKHIKKLLALTLCLLLLATFTPAITLATTDDIVKDWSAGDLTGLTLDFMAGGGVGTPSVTWGASYGNISVTPWTGQWFSPGSVETSLIMTASAAGFSNMTLSARLGGNARVPENYKLQYALGDSAWVDVPGGGAIKATTASSSAAAIPFSVDLPAAANRAATLQLRLVQTSFAPSAQGSSSATTNAGSLYIYGLQLTGTALVARPVISKASGLIAAGTAVTITCATPGASVYYSINGGADTLYTGAITINADTVLSAYAQVGADRSGTATATYTVWDGAPLNIKQVLDMSTATGFTLPGVTVFGQIAYRYNSIVLQDTIGGTVYALSAFPFFDTEQTSGGTGDPVGVGDWVKVTGTYYVRYGVPQMQGITEIEKTVPGVDSKAPRVFANFDEMDSAYNYSAAGFNYLINRYCKITNIKLGAVSGNYATVTDVNNRSMQIYMPAPYPVDTGVGDMVNLHCVASTYNNNRQLQTGSSRDYEVLSDTKAPHIYLPIFNSAPLGVDYVVTVEADDNVGVASLTIAYVINGVSYGPFPMIEGEEGVYSFTIPGTQIVAGPSDEIALTFVAKDAAAHTTTETGSIHIADDPRVVSVTPTAGFATGSEKRPLISAAFENAGVNPTVTMTVNGSPVAATVTGTVISYTPTTDLADGSVTVAVTVTRADSKTTTFTWNFYIGAPTYNLYFGQLHSHTAQYSDGSGTLEQAFDYASRTAKHTDFLAVTDHSNYFDTSSNLGSMTDATKGTAGTGGKTLWQNAKDMTARYNDPADVKHKDGFVALYGYEMTWSGGPGHINTFNSVGFESRNSAILNNKTNDAGMIAYYNRLVEVGGMDEALGGRKTISQFNHPGVTFGTFKDFAYYTAAYDQYISLIEVGNGEGKIGGSSYWPSYEHYTVALDKGWHLAPTNNQDNHKGLWGDSNTARDVVSIMGDFTEEAVYDALRDMRVYATEDDDLQIQYTLNGEMMGSILNLGDSEMLNIQVNFNDPTDRVQKLSVIVNGGQTAISKEFNSNSGTWNVQIPNEYSYYYIRVDEVDSQIAVTAPVWTKETIKIGISSLSKNTLIDVKGEPIAFSSTLYNYQADDTVTVTKLEWFVGGVLQATVTPGTIIGIGTAVPAPVWNYVPTAVGRQEVKLVATFMYKGTELTSTAKININVRDGANMATMLIDAYHANFYVSGDYAGSYTGLIELAAANGVRTVEIREPITDAVLENCTLLVMSVPFKGAGVAIGAQNYTQDEIDAIERYAARGGNFVITSKSDRLEPAAANEKASVISNRLLTAIGAKARFGRGIVVDNVTKANEAYRLYFLDKDNYNFDSKMLEYLLETTNTLYSNYNGGPIILNGATPVIRAESTAWVSSYADYFTGSAYVPNETTNRSADYYAACGSQTDVVVMAEETLPGGGYLLTCGTTFFSTFEVKVALENAGSLQNANYQIAVNLFRLLYPQTITPIADIHELGVEGKEYTIEGYVTSNASGHDQKTAFFDCIYLQDESGRGINVFPVAGDYQIGQKLRITGTTSSYMGEIELNVSDDFGGEISDRTIYPYAERADLTDVTAVMGSNKQSVAEYSLDYTRLQAELDLRCASAKAAVVEGVIKQVLPAGTAVDDDHVGNYVEFEGYVIKVEYDGNGVVGAIHVKGTDGKTAIVFLDGYIECDDGCVKGADGYHDLSFATVGAYILVRGISSVGQNSYEIGEQMGHRIRIRNRVDIELATAPVLDYSALEDALDDAHTLITGEIATSELPGGTDLPGGTLYMTAEEKAAYLAALAAAEALEAARNATTQEEIDDIVRALLEALGAIKHAETPPVVVDKSALRAAIDDAIEFMNDEQKHKFSDVSDALQEAWEIALLEAIAVYNNPDATQAEVDAATARLNALSKTGESMLIFVACGIALLGIVGIVVVVLLRKRKEHRGA